MFIPKELGAFLISISSPSSTVDIPWFPHEVTKEWIFPNISLSSPSLPPSSSSHPPPPPHAFFSSGDERRGARRCNQPWRSGEPGPKQAGVHSYHFGHRCLHFVIISWIIHIMIRRSSFQSPLGWSNDHPTTWKQSIIMINDHDKDQHQEDIMINNHDLS